MAEMLRLGIDTDNVLVPTFEALLQWWNKKHNTNITTKDLGSHEFSTTFGMSKEAAVNMFEDFFKTWSFRFLGPFDEAKFVIDSLREKAELYNVTARPKKYHPFTTSWTKRNFEDAFKIIRFCNYHDLSDKIITKAEICKQYGIQMLVDDNIDYANECAEQGIRVLLFDNHGTYGWSQGKTHELVTKIPSLYSIKHHVEEFLEELNRKK